MLNPMILFGKLHIRKSKTNNYKPCLKVFMVDLYVYFWILSNVLILINVKMLFYLLKRSS